MKQLYLSLLFAVVALSANAQRLTVSGKVTDEQSAPIAGVTVLVGETNAVAITDAGGQFSLQNVQRGNSLTFNIIGYLPQTVVVQSATVDVQLVTDAQVVDDVVVIAYGQASRVTLTGAVSAVSNKDLLKSPAASLGNALAGRLPGVQSVQYSGMPGADDPQIFIRGMGTLNNSSPLVLVDGVERAFSQIDPNEVANISILKDASSTAVFGVRGANGVILVTTKRGADGKVSVSFSAQGGIQQISDYLDPASSYEYASAYDLAEETDGTSKAERSFSDTTIQHFKDRDMLKVYPDTNWFDYLMKDAAWQSQFNVNVSGGNETAKFFVSAGMLNQDGLFETLGQSKEANFKYKRYNYRANLDLNLSKRSTLSINVGGRVQNRNSIGGGEGGNDGGDGGLFANQGLLNSGQPFSGYGLDEEGRRLVSNPKLIGTKLGADALGRLYQLGWTKRSENTLNLDLIYKLKMDFLTEGLDFNVKGSYNSTYTQIKDREHGFGSGVSYMTGLDVDGNLTLVKQGDASPLPYEERLEGGRDWYMEASFNYARDFGAHKVGALLLYNQSKTYYPWDRLNLYRSIPKGYVGLVGRITYDYDTRYLAEFNVGYNGSENFAPGKRYGLFPSISVGWIASNEKFWEPIKNWFSYVKVRASLGTVGNDSTNDMRFLYLPWAFEFYSANGGASYPDYRTAMFGVTGNTWQPGSREKAMGNPDVTWETAIKQNYGIDLGFFRDKLTASVDVFFEDRRDILQSNRAFLSGVTGLQENFINYGQVKNHGYEITLKWADRKGDFSYSIAPALTFARSEVVKTAEGILQYDYLSAVGLPVGQPFGRELFEYFDPATTPDAYKAKYGVDMPNQNVSLKPGDAVYVDMNDDGIINSYDVKPIGYTDVPEYTASLNLTFTYKGFDLSMLWIGATNSNRMLGAYYRPPFGTGNTSMLNKWVYDNSWTEENPGAMLPRMTFTNRSHNYDPASTIWQIDASYIRLKNAEIGYTFSKIPWLPQIGSVRVYATGYNLLTFAKFKGNDPEARQGEWGTFIKYPMTRVINFGVNVNF